MKDSKDYLKRRKHCKLTVVVQYSVEEKHISFVLVWLTMLLHETHGDTKTAIDFGQRLTAGLHNHREFAHELCDLSCGCNYIMGVIIVFGMRLPPGLLPTIKIWK